MYSLNTSELKSAPSHQGCWRHGPHQTIYASLCAELYDHSDVAGSHFLWWLPSIVCSGGGLVECPIPSVRLLSMKGWTQVWVGYFVAPETPKCFLESSSSQLGCQPETSTLYSLYTYGQKHLPLQIVNTCLLWSLCFLHNILLVFSISTFWTSSQSSVDDSKIHVTCSRILCPETTNQTPLPGSYTRQASALRFGLAQWGAWVASTAHWKCCLWSLPCKNLVAGRVPWLWALSMFSKGKYPHRNWSCLQGLCSSTWQTLGPSISDTEMAGVWGDPRWSPCHGGGSQQAVQCWRWVYGEWWKDLCMDFAFSVYH